MTEARNSVKDTDYENCSSYDNLQTFANVCGEETEKNESSSS
jgi:hypothetical protein